MSDRSITPLPPADFTPTLGDYKDLQPFRFWCQKVLPLVYDDSLSYYELLCKVVDYLNKTMEDVGVLESDVTGLHESYKKLQNYVNSYFSTLDVQEEINNKLDGMAKDGTLTNLIRVYIDPLIDSQNKKIGVLEERMNTFTQLPSGSTTADAELIDIRVPANGFNGGKAYPTAGDSVRGQVSSLKEDIDALNANIETNPSFSFILSQYYSSTGEITSAGSWCTTSLIDVSNYHKVFYSGLTNIGGENVNSVFFNENNKAILVFKQQTSGEVIIPKNAKYASFSVSINDRNSFEIVLKTMIDVNAISEKVENNTQSVEKLESKLDSLDITQEKNVYVTYTNSLYWNNEGKKISAGAWKITNNIEISSYDAIIYDSLINVGGDTVNSVFLDENNKVISTFKQKSGHNIIYDFPKNSKYISFSVINTENISVTLSKNKLAIIVNGVSVKNKKVVTFGDSMFLNGNAKYSNSWQEIMRDYFEFENIVSVGIGGSGFVWDEKKGYDMPISHVLGENLPYNSGISETANHNSAFCSWYRISNTVPSDSNIIIIGTGTNDYGAEEFPSDNSDLNFITGSNIDSEWAKSKYYSEFGGDYNIKTRRGSILSCIMKMQYQAPNAMVILMNFPNTRLENGTGKNATSTQATPLQKPILDAMEYVHKWWGIPLIDLISTSGINPLNRAKYCIDGIHPNEKGYKLFANAVIAGLKPLLNNME